MQASPRLRCVAGCRWRRTTSRRATAMLPCCRAGGGVDLGDDLVTVYFVAPDAQMPKGGVRRLYLWADVLNRRGIPSAIVHHRRGFRCQWFENSTPIVAAADLRLLPSDVLAVPEVFGPAITRLAPGIRKVIVNQGAYRTFSKFSLDSLRGGDIPYRHPDVVAVLVVSDDSRRYLEHVFPQLAVQRVHIGIDPSLHHLPSRPPGHRIAYMPRKRKAQAKEVLQIALLRGALEGWELVPIDGRSEKDAAQQLRDSAIFLSFSEGEGFGLPPAEAMASGSVVIGFHGQGGSEFFDPGHSFPVPDGDVLGFAQTLEGVLTTFDAQAERYAEMGARASEFIRANYSMEQEAEDVVAVFGPLVGPGGSVGRSVTIDRRLLKPRAEGLRDLAFYLRHALIATKALVRRR